MAQEHSKPEIRGEGADAPLDTAAALREDRRRLLKRTVVAGVPVVLASVRGRNAWAWTRQGSATSSVKRS
jgi:hypothetical protein